MATTMTTKQNWSTYAVLQSSKGGGKTYTVDINEQGQFRCRCPGYIFSGKGGAVRTCKHVRRCEQERLVEGKATTPVTRPVVAQAPAPAQHAEALKIFNAMCEAGTTRAKANVANLLGMATCEAMIKALAAQLQTYIPAPVPLATTGTRYITFDD